MAPGPRVEVRSLGLTFTKGLPPRDPLAERAPLPVSVSTRAPSTRLSPGSRCSAALACSAVASARTPPRALPGWRGRWWRAKPNSRSAGPRCRRTTPAAGAGTCRSGRATRLTRRAASLSPSTPTARPATWCGPLPLRLFHRLGRCPLPDGRAQQRGLGGADARPRLGAPPTRGRTAQKSGFDIHIRP